MVETTPKVDWQLYAEKYDMLLEFNPYYQRLRTELLAETAKWTIPEGGVIADIGAGTGNYSVPLAQQFPQAMLLHIDNTTAMNDRARYKITETGQKNWQLMEQGIESVQLAENSLAGMISVHALYTFPDPPAALKAMYRWLEPGGMALLVDPGRIVKVLPWQLAIGWHLLTRQGLKRTLQIFREAKAVSEQNRYIREMQRKGEFWTHTHDEFCTAVEAAGFLILRHRTCFRGLSDQVLVTKK